MNKSNSKYLVFMTCAVLFAGGCAKKELVKQDEAISLTASAKGAETSSDRTPSNEIPARDALVKEQPVEEAIGASQAVGETAGTSPTAGAAVEQEAGFETLFFDFDSSILTPAARDTLVRNGKLMEKRAGVKVRIEGHCDDLGSDEYNMALGEKRARAAMQYLVALGVPAQRLAVISYGKEKPADPGDNEAARARNRRDDFVVMSK